MKIAMPNQIGGEEARVAMIPSAVETLAGNGHQVLVEAGAGTGAHHGDAEYEKAGGLIVPAGEPVRLWGQADLIVTLHPPTHAQAEAIQSGTVLVGMMAPLSNLKSIKTLSGRGVSTFSMEFLPRISRAQAMDVLSSQASISGYKAVVLAAEHCPKMFPMMITAAGTIAPSRVFVIGAGVAGLQAIATAKRLGAIVEAYDVRAATKEQVQSIGGRFVELPATAQDDSASGGYARQQTDQQRRQQVELMAKHVVGADCVISTAAVFGKSPPLLVPADMVERMKAGSVVVDLAASKADHRGNCELTQPGKIISTDQGVTVVGLTNLPALVPVHASQVYSTNLLAFMAEIIEEGALKIDREDELHAGALITYEGSVVNEMVAKAMV